MQEYCECDESCDCYTLVTCCDCGSDDCSERCECDCNEEY